MISFSVEDLLHAVLLLLFLEGALYLFFPVAIQNFATQCIIDTKPANLRLFGILLIIFAIFLMMIVFPFLVE